MKRTFLLSLTALLWLSTFAAPKYLVQTGKSGDAEWSDAVATTHSATIVNLATEGKTLNEWINATFTSYETSNETWIAAGTYNLSGSFTAGWSSVKLYGGFVGTETSTTQRVVGNNPWEMTNPTILDGGETVQIYTGSPAFGGTWDGLTLTKCNSAKGGVAALYNNAKINNCRFIDNSASTHDNSAITQGGALHVYQKNGVNISNCYFENNTASQGGAIYIANNDKEYTLVIDHCYFKDNNASHSTNAGGAVYFQNPGTYIVNACVFDHNNASGNGSAIFSSVTGDGASTNITNCLFKNQQNSTKTPIYLLQGSILNCTFASNAGGSLYVGGTGSSMRVENNIVWGANATECNISIGNEAGYTLKNNVLCKMIAPEKVTKENNYYLTYGDDRYFMDAANGNYHLSWRAMEMIGKGCDLSSDGITADLEGTTRSANDIGCYASPWNIASRSVAADTYGTWCTPKAVNADEFEGATFWRIVGTTSGGSELVIEQVDALEAGHAYIYESTSTLIRLNLTGEDAAEPIAGNGLQGTYSDINNLRTYLEAKSVTYDNIYVIYNGAIYRAGEDLKIPAKRAWIDLSEVPDADATAPAPNAVRRRMPNANYVPTALDEVSETNGREGVYDILGRRVSAPVAGGMYIVNGQKVIMQ
ncbi:MAG: hypothetical protein IJ581_03920 [Paludibacteraceae bacterium]|nr:hypothetical protein [Paludibacteraceae bacterium]